MTRHEELIEALRHNFGFDQFKGNQEAIINNLMDGNDTFVLMPTGGGKSLCYQLPSLLMEGTAIVISPLIALMKNQVDAMRNYSEEDGIAHFINSSLSRPEIQAVKDDILAGKTKLLYVAPESLQKMENVDFLKQVKISFYAVDEAHCISEWGHDFRPEYRNIQPTAEKIGRAPIIALTATATPKVQKDIQKNLGMLDAKVFKSSFNRPNLYYEVRQKTNEVDKDIIRYIKKNMEGKSGIIYCLSRKTVEDLAAILRENDITALPYHAGMEGPERTKNQDAFLMEECQVIVATIAFGMGIDKPDVRFVIHYDVPKSLEGYYQETGRAGRDGGEGQCICYYNAKDLGRLEKFMLDKQVNEREIGKQLLEEMKSYCEGNICRRKFLLHYFGEEYNKDNCENCDNCKKIHSMVDEQEILSLVIELVLELKEKFKTEHIIDILRGIETGAVITYDHSELELFGAADDQDAETMQAIIRQAILSGYLKKDIDSFGNLKVTSAGKKFLKKPVEFKVPLTREDDEDEMMMGPELGGSAAADTVLFSILKDMRKALSKRLDVPPFVIFQDPSLEAMATTYPITMDELQNIPGVGAGKAKRYGAEFLRVIKEYVEENEIIRPEDMRIKTVAKNSQNKISIIQAIDRKKDLDDLAESKGMDMDELLDEIEAIIYSGTKLNINYFIEEIMDPDKEEEIFDYFRNAATDNIKVAMRELDSDDISEIDVRLVRIKFHSELGN
ncbi:MAG: DNA helicase RecQ [Paludibacteraceae bacterium]|nr:DNA helicase RecQ [Paludibacteraceae bacterium]